MAKLTWERIDDEWDDPARPMGFTYRAEVRGGWLVSVWAGTKRDQRWGGGLTFVPDPDHAWRTKMVK